jgi:hypothetical protein
VVSSVSPVSGDGTGNTTVSITGTDFISGAQVYFGAALASDITVSDSEHISCQSPAGTGVVEITVLNTDGQSGTLLDAFTYTGATGIPTVSGGVCPCIRGQ